MKRIILTIIFTLLTGALNSVTAQTPSEDGIRIRSAELARVKRMDEVELNADGSGKIDIARVKKYFEGIQKLQDSIVQAYTTGKKIDYRKINKSSGKMTEMAVKLKTALFLTAKSSQVSGKTKKPEVNGEKQVKELIVDLDNAIGRFVTNRIFRNEKINASESSEKALSDLEEIINLSGALRFEAKREKTF